MNIIKKLTIPQGKRIFFVGDIHGRYDELLSHLKAF